MKNLLKSIGLLAVLGFWFPSVLLTAGSVQREVRQTNSTDQVLAIPNLVSATHLFEPRFRSADGPGRLSQIKPWSALKFEPFDLGLGSPNQTNGSVDVLAWLTSWQFNTRTAGLPRAPNLI